MKLRKIFREKTFGNKPPLKLSSQAFQNFVHFLKKNRPEPISPDIRANNKILIVKKMGLRDDAPYKIREEIQAVFK
jgi:hypothetical protein